MESRLRQLALEVTQESSTSGWDDGMGSCTGQAAVGIPVLGVSGVVTTPGMQLPRDHSRFLL